MKVILAPEDKNEFDHSTVTISCPADDLTADQVVEHLIRPALLAYGYAEKTVDEALGNL